MNVSHDMSMLALIWNASAVVQFVMALLLVVSSMSWYFIFRKWFAIRQARTKTEQFERDFWGGSDLNALYQSAVNHRHSTGSLERIFEADLAGSRYDLTALIPVSLADRLTVSPLSLKPIVALLDSARSLC